jgi:hypothetical protein
MSPFNTPFEIPDEFRTFSVYPATRDFSRTSCEILTYAIQLHCLPGRWDSNRSHPWKVGYSAPDRQCPLYLNSAQTFAPQRNAIGKKLLPFHTKTKNTPCGQPEGKATLGI